MLDRVNKYIKDENLIPSGEKVVIAVSSGMDSMALLHILTKLGYKVIIAHVNHQKREQSIFEEEYIVSYAKDNNIPCEVYHLDTDVNKNFHDDAHIKRYEFFYSVLKKYHVKYLATAHHADDNAETIILNIMRGSNAFGYGGISSKINYQDYAIIRPLLKISKEEIKEYINTNKIVYFEDESNSLDEYKRNRIRHHIIPKMKIECDDFLEKVSLYSKQIKEAFAYLRKDSINYLNDNNNIIDVESFKNLHIALQKDIVCLLLEGYNITKNEDVLENIIKLITNAATSASIDLANNYSLVKRYNKVYIIQKKEAIFESILLDLNQKVIFKDKYAFYLTENVENINANYVKLCYNSLEFPLTIRSYKENDIIQMSFGHKKLNRLFIDKKIPLENRNDIPIIESNDEILWVYNLAKSNKLVEMKKNGEIYLVCEEKKYEK